MAGEWYQEADATFVVRNVRRRRRRWWRLPLRLVTLAALAGAGVLGYFALYPPPLPLAEIESARASLLRAQTEARALAGDEVARAEALGQVMERLLAEERSQLIRFRENERLAASARDVDAASRAALDRAKASLETSLLQARERRVQLEHRLSALVDDVEALSADRMLRSRFQGARLAIDQLADAERMQNLDLVRSRLAPAEEALAKAEAALATRLARLHDPALQRKWQRWVDDTLAKRGLSIIVDKLRRRLFVVRDRRVIAQYEAEFGRNGLSDKIVAGDAATPEGRYRVTKKKDVGKSRYHSALVLDYPTAEDIAEFNAAKRRGAVRGRSPGSAIEIHGEGGKGAHWTDGCVALRNGDMDRLFKLSAAGTPVTIVGTARLPGD